MYGSSSVRKRSAVKRLLKCPWGGGSRASRAGPGPTRPCGGAGFFPDPRRGGLCSRPLEKRRQAAADPAAEGARRWRTERPVKTAAGGGGEVGLSGGRG